VNVTRGIEALDRIRRPLAISLGVFDGVHRGHAAVFAALRREADALRAAGVIVTLNPHPLEVVRPEIAPRLLTTPEERVRLLETHAPDAVVVCPFDRETADLAPLSFLERLVPNGGRLAALVVGHDFRMGKDRAAGYEKLRKAGRQRGFRVVRVDPVRENGGPISSSRIRRLVEGGRLTEAEELLGHPYGLQGRVVPGRGVGRTLSFPTANVDVGDDRKLLPRFGVYAVRVRTLSEEATGDPWPGVSNIGVRPTFGKSDPVVEVHLPDFTGELTGLVLGVEFVERIRDEETFPNPRALAKRISADVERAREILRDREGLSAGRDRGRSGEAR
jgi:riboflavin kinase/FMN adenylyltransferase